MFRLVYLADLASTHVPVKEKTPSKTVAYCFIFALFIQYHFVSCFPLMKSRQNFSCGSSKLSVEDDCSSVSSVTKRWPHGKEAFYYVFTMS